MHTCAQNINSDVSNQEDFLRDPAVWKNSPRQLFWRHPPVGAAAGALWQRAVQHSGPALAHHPPGPHAAKEERQKHGGVPASMWSGPSQEHHLPAVTGGAIQALSAIRGRCILTLQSIPFLLSLWGDGRGLFSVYSCVLSPTVFSLQVPHHTSLAWLLACRTPTGWLARMTQWKVWCVCVCVSLCVCVVMDGWPHRQREPRIIGTWLALASLPTPSFSPQTSSFTSEKIRHTVLLCLCRNHIYIAPMVSFRAHNSSLEGTQKLKFAPFCSYESIT